MTESRASKSDLHMLTTSGDTRVQRDSFFFSSTFDADSSKHSTSQQEHQLLPRPSLLLTEKVITFQKDPELSSLSFFLEEMSEEMEEIVEQAQRNEEQSHARDEEQSHARTKSFDNRLSYAPIMCFPPSPSPTRPSAQGLRCESKRKHISFSLPSYNMSPNV